MIGSRTPNSPGLTEWKKSVGARGSTGTFAEAAKHGELLVVATLGQAAEAAVELAGPAHFSGKVVIDTTNPLDFSKGMPPGVFTDGRDSLAERIQAKIPKGRVVKCFNMVPNSMMIDPKTPDGAPDMIICGDDPAAKREVTQILTTFGWPRTIDVGELREATWIEAWVPLWVRIAGALKSYNVAMKIVGG